MPKICLIYLPSGLGDVLFIQKICKHYHSLGFKIILPVVYEHEWLNDYIDNVTFVSWQDKEHKLTHKDKLPDHVIFPKKEYYDPFAPCIFTEDFVYLNLYLPPQGPVMKDKYRIANVPWENWQDDLIFHRNKEKEDDLYYNRLGLKDGEDYIFLNKLYQMRPCILYYDRISSQSETYGGKKVVEMSIIDGVSLIDWLGVVERSSMVVMIESSLNYLMESPQVRDNLPKELHLFSRYSNFCEVDYLFKLPWKFHR